MVGTGLGIGIRKGAAYFMAGIAAIVLGVFIFYILTVIFAILSYYVLSNEQFNYELFFELRDYIFYLSLVFSYSIILTSAFYIDKKPSSKFMGLVFIISMIASSFLIYLQIYLINLLRGLGLIIPLIVPFILMVLIFIGCYIFDKPPQAKSAAIAFAISFFAFSSISLIAVMFMVGSMIG